MRAGVLVDQRRSERRRAALHAALGALREKAPLVELAGAAASAPRQRDSRFCAIAQKAGPGGVPQTGLLRHHGDVHRAVAEAMPVGSLRRHSKSRCDFPSGEVARDAHAPVSFAA